MTSQIDLMNRNAIQFNQAINERMMLSCNSLKNLGITNFGYLKFFKDGTYLKLTNDKDWGENYIKNSLVDRTEAFAETLKESSLFTIESQLWPKSLGNDCLSNLYDHNIWNGINFHIKTDKYIEVFYFATTRENTQIFNLYLHHLDLLKRFIFYFKDKYRDVIDNNDKNNLAKQYCESSFFDLATCSSSQNAINQNISSFLLDTEVKRYYLNGGLSHIFFTKKECICLRYLASGKTTKEIGNILHISSRTVESYINNMKRKAGVSFSSQLIDIFLSSNFKDCFF